MQNLFAGRKIGGRLMVLMGSQETPGLPVTEIQHPHSLRPAGGTPAAEVLCPEAATPARGKALPVFPLPL